MAEPARSFRLSLETKVMMAVLAVLIVLPVVTLWIVDHQFQRQLQLDAELALRTARLSFEQSLKHRRDELAARFQAGQHDQRFLTVLGLKDPATMQDYLASYALEEFGEDTELAAFISPDKTLFAGARRGTSPVNLDAFVRAADSFVQAALERDIAPGSVAVGGNVYNVVALPVVPTGRGLVGVLVFGIRISNTTLERFKPPSAEIMVVEGTQVAASTLRDPEENRAVLAQLQQLEPTLPGSSPRFVTVAQDRYLPVTGVLDPGSPRHSFRYVLLSASEQRLRSLAETRVTLIGLSAAAILASAVIVWFFVRRITQPLVDLRDNAEAVGRGDFSRRIDRFSNDECGELAEAFNRMTSNLQSSRAELETAMQQVRTTQEQLIQSEKLSAVGQFVAGVAHELNNPLTAVVGFSELLQSMSIDDKIRSHLDRIAKSAHRCHKIVHSLLSFARQDAPERKIVQLHTVLDEVLELMAYEMRTSDISLVKEYAARLPPIMADPHQLQQVFVNILGNARQAMEQFQRRGKIVIRTREVGKSIVIEFEDNGPGIRPEHLSRIFDPFFTTKPVGKGTGLGLSLCYGIIQEHGGIIAARSELGQGATFAIELPVATDASHQTLVEGRGASATPFPLRQRPPSGKTVLVIDDEEWILELAAELLRGEGHAVETALGGQQALELINQRKFDAILSDWKMPGLNGIRLYEHLRAADPRAANRVLFMTGDVVNDTFQNFLREHALACLSKPFATGEFRAAVAKVFGADGGGEPAKAR